MPEETRWKLITPMEPEEGKHVLCFGMEYGDPGYTEDRCCFYMCSRRGDDFNVVQPTGRYFSGFEPLTFLEIPNFPKEVVDILPDVCKGGDDLS